MINKITCESKKIVSKLLNVGVENNRKLFQGNGVIISTNDIDKMEIKTHDGNDINFLRIVKDRKTWISKEFIRFFGCYRQRLYVSRFYKRLYYAVNEI